MIPIFRTAIALVFAFTHAVTPAGHPIAAHHADAHRALIAALPLRPPSVMDVDFVPAAAPEPEPAPQPAADEQPAPQPAADEQPAPQPAARQLPAVYTAPAPAPPPPAPAPPPPVVGSAQQSYINSDRAAAGLPALSWSSCLAGVAYQNAQRMAAAGAISHAGGTSADFGCGLGSRQTGENVGYWSGGVNDAQLNSMFMNSPEHRANIMGPYRYVGTAWVVARNGYAYIAVEFG